MNVCITCSWFLAGSQFYFLHEVSEVYGGGLQIFLSSKLLYSVFFMIATWFCTLSILNNNNNNNIINIYLQIPRELTVRQALCYICFIYHILCNLPINSKAYIILLSARLSSTLPLLTELTC